MRRPAIQSSIQQSWASAWTRKSVEYHTPYVCCKLHPILMVIITSILFNHFVEYDLMQRWILGHCQCFGTLCDGKGWILHATACTMLRMAPFLFPGLFFYVYVKSPNPKKPRRLNTTSPKPHQLKTPTPKSQFKTPTPEPP